MTLFSSSVSSCYSLAYGLLAPMGIEMPEDAASRSVAQNAHIQDALKELGSLCKPAASYLSFGRAVEPDLLKISLAAVKLGVHIYEAAEPKCTPESKTAALPDPRTLAHLLKISLVSIAKGKSKAELAGDSKYVTAVRSILRVLARKYAQDVLSGVEARAVTKALINRSIDGLKTYLSDLVPLSDEEIKAELKEAFFTGIMNARLQARLTSFEMAMTRKGGSPAIEMQYRKEFLYDFIYNRSHAVHGVGTVVLASHTEYAEKLITQRIPEAETRLQANRAEYLRNAVSIAQQIVQKYEEMSGFIPGRQTDGDLDSLVRRNELELSQARANLAFLQGIDPSADVDPTVIDSKLNFTLLPYEFHLQMQRMKPYLDGSRAQYIFSRQALPLLKEEAAALAGVGFDPAVHIVKDEDGHIVGCHRIEGSTLSRVWPSEESINEAITSELTSTLETIKELRRVFYMAQSGAASTEEGAGGKGSSESESIASSAAGAGSRSSEVDASSGDITVGYYSARTAFDALIG